jgi:hypothetical protein
MIYHNLTEEEQAELDPCLMDWEVWKLDGVYYGRESNWKRDERIISHDFTEFVGKIIDYEVENIESNDVETKSDDNFIPYVPPTVDEIKADPKSKKTLKFFSDNRFPEIGP